MAITIENLHKHTAEQVYNAMRDHLLSMTKRSRNEDGNSCMYRGKNGAKCAAGIFIPDEVYTKEMESNSWNTLFDKGHVPEAHLWLISDMQSVHDIAMHWNPSGGLNDIGRAALEQVKRMHLD